MCTSEIADSCTDGEQQARGGIKITFPTEKALAAVESSYQAAQKGRAPRANWIRQPAGGQGLAADLAT